LRSRVSIDCIGYREIGPGFDLNSRLQAAIRMTCARFGKLGSIPSFCDRSQTTKMTPLRYRTGCALQPRPWDRNDLDTLMPNLKHK
jgi:hypothetical protein